MKNLLFTILLFGLIFQAQSQTKNLATTPSELLKKSNNQYKTGLILIGSGTAFLLTAIAMPPTYSDYDGSSNHTVKSILSLTGAISIIVSVPVFLSAGQNGRLAARLSLENQALNQPISFPGHPKSMTALSLKIPI
ncbi:hypothetical protein [Algoriphagus sp. A40]|uniref:hypothetical protein n=1 Tax=Algoriphagus sp. A40 TaxID=1945863 RepID=UPI0009855681|nr:hypothetical protein [Algoriphagus sp. A40]OOG78631.1 hypothetical protein B0E43_00665 [Algoriphagus sp. A40]